MAFQETTLNGFRFLLLPEDAISSVVLSGKPWEPHCLEIMRRFVKEGDTVLDAGANFGFHALHLSRQVGKQGKVFAFEPQRIVFQQLCFHLFLNQAFNVWAYPLALASGFGRTTISELHETEIRNIGATPVGQGSTNVDVVPLDHFQPEKFSFLKVDIQGCETSFLKGALSILKSNRPLMFIEIEENWLRRLGSSSKELIEALFALDYVLLKIETEWPTDHLCVAKERKEEVLQTLQDFPWRITILEGKEIELQFGAEPFYSEFKILG